MRILHVIDGLGRGGAESLLINTIQLLPADEHVVICLSTQYEFEPGIKKQFTHITIPVANKLKIPFAIIKIKQIIKSYSPHLIHVHLPLSGIITKLAAPKNIPLFYTIHSEYSFCYFNKNRLLKMLENFSARPYHHLMGVSKIAVDDYTEHIKKSGSKDVLYNFVANDFFSVNKQSNYKPGSPLRCMAVGNLKYEKNYQYMLSQFSYLKKLPISLDIFGDGEDAQYLNKLKEDNQLTNITFKGKQPNIYKLMGQYDVFISSSVTEGFGIAPVEAMAAKLPVVVSSIRVFKELIDDVGIFINIDDERSPNSLSVTLQKIYQGQINIADKIEPAFNRAVQIASSNNYINQLKEIYQKYL